MSTTQEQIESIQKEIRETPYHKGTEHHIGRLRARIAQLKDKQLDEGSKKGGGGGGGYAIKKQGDATVVLVGPPSSGKSTLINKLTNAHSKVAPYSFTTVTVIPGMMNYNNARIQILDVPGLIQGARLGKGRGKEVLSVIRGSDLMVMITDINRIGLIKQIQEELEETGIRINKTAPKVKIEKKISGGIEIRSNFAQEFNKETVKEIARQYRITNAEITIGQKLSLDQLIDLFSRNRVYIPSIVVVNKIDKKPKKKLPTGFLAISADQGINMETLKESIWENLKLITIYLVKENEQPHNDNPMVVPIHASLNDILSQLGSDFAESINFAKIWGTGAKHKGQQVSLSLKAQNGMQIRFVK